MPLEAKLSGSYDDLFAKTRTDKWENQTALVLMVINGPFLKPFLVKFHRLTKEFLKANGQKFKESDKIETHNSLNSFSNAKFDNSENVRNYILKLVQIATRPREINRSITEDLIIHGVFDSLPLEYEQSEVSHTTLQDKWSIVDLITVCVQKEHRLSKKRAKKAHLTTTASRKKHSNSKKFRFRKKNYQGNGSNSRNDQNKSSKNKILASFARGMGISRQTTTTSKQ